MGALAGELTVALKIAINKSSKKAISYTKELDEIAKKTDDIIKKNTDEAGNLSKEVEDALQRRAALDKLDELAGVQRKVSKEFQEFVRKWKGKSITKLSKGDISNALRGTTEQANKVADIIDSGKMKFAIWDDAKFVKYLTDTGDTLDEAIKTAAFTELDVTFYRASKSIGEFMSEIVHEGTHALDNLKIEKLLKSGKTQKEIDAIFGNQWSVEKRAYFYERAFQIATEIEVDFESIDDMLLHIFTEYKPY